ncbi:hypothetical protein BH23ACT2_BH23ACT2_23560 [soil metagenome]
MAYETIRRLGRGGMGVVDLARDEHGREVALKRLSLHGTPDELETARRRIRREAEVLQQLDHPAIVALLDVFDDGDDLVLVMDHLPGGNLASRVNAEGPLPAEQVQDIGDRLLDALATAHRAGVVHRDIKPANVLFDADGNAALADFGAAIHRDATPGLTASELVVGTPGFMAPEQARGEVATAASDVFSLGATLAFAASGDGPFGTADPRVLMLRAAAGRTEKLAKSLPPDLRRRLTAMLDREPARRPTAAAAAGGPAGTHPRTVTRLATRDRRAPLVALAVVALVAVGAVAALVVGTDDSSDALPAPASPTVPNAAPTTTEPPCQDLPYQPCGEPPAPNTNGETCLASFADYDGDASTGCEAEPIGPPSGTELTDRITANLVPADDVDAWPTPVTDTFNLRCDGRLTITFTAPAEVSQRVTVLAEDGDELGTGVSADAVPVEVSVIEPGGCFADDTQTLTVEVTSAGTDRTAEPYTLIRRGSF